jgi:hypothetical protein
MKTASAPAVAVTASPAAAVTASPVLSECGICQECKTDDRSKCDERSAKTECAHNLYLPLELESAFSREPIVKRTAPLLHQILLLGTRLRGCYVKLTLAVWRLPDDKPLERLTMCNSSIANPELL